MTAIPTFLRLDPNKPFADMTDSLLAVTRDYWRIMWDDAPGFVTAVGAAEKLQECEVEMRRRGMTV